MNFFKRNRKRIIILVILAVAGLVIFNRLRPKTSKELTYNPQKDQIPQAKKDFTKLMREKYDEDAFTVFDSSQLLTSINSIIGTLTIALTGIAAISLVVGGISIILGFLSSLAINHFFLAEVAIPSVLLAFGASSAVGVIFGVAPARKASQLSPIVALRYE